MAFIFGSYFAYSSIKIGFKLPKKKKKIYSTFSTFRFSYNAFSQKKTIQLLDYFATILLSKNFQFQQNKQITNKPLELWLLHINYTSVQQLKWWGENTISNLKSCLQLTFSIVCTPMCLYTLMCKYLPKVYNTIYGSWFLVIPYLLQKFKEFH